MQPAQSYSPIPLNIDKPAWGIHMNNLKILELLLLGIRLSFNGTLGDSEQGSRKKDVQTRGDASVLLQSMETFH